MSPDKKTQVLRYTVDGKKYLFGDLTLDELATLEAELGVPWITFHTNGDAKHTRAILAAFYARTLGAGPAAAKAGALTLSEYYDAVSWVDDPDDDGTPDPKAPKSTKTRSGSSTS